jgi:Rieske Fe-S protein
MSADGLSRRSVLNGCAISAAAAVVGFVAAKRSDAAQPKSATAAANAYGTVQSTGGHLLAKLAQVPAGSGLILASAGVVLTQDNSGTVHGFSATCTHQGCTVGSIEGGAIVCPCHGSRFDISTGAPVQGPATKPLPTVAVVVTGDGVFTS